MAGALATAADTGLSLASNDSMFPVVPWRDPHTVSPAELRGFIQKLEQACLDNPSSADLRTCLGMAYAVGHDVYKSMDALEAAIEIDPRHFWGQLKYAELLYRLRALPRAEEETLKAVNLARNMWQLSIARKQLQEIRRLLHEGTRTVTWNKSLVAPSLTFVAMLGLITIAMVWR